MPDDKSSGAQPPPVPPLPPFRPGTAVRIGSSNSQPAARMSAAPAVPVRPLVASRTTVHSSSSSTHPAGSDLEVITLTQPRPDGERTRNEYIDTPLKGGINASGCPRDQRHRSAGSLLGGSTPLHAETHPHIHISGSPHDHLALVSPLGGHQVSHKSSPSKSLSATPTSPSLKRTHSARRSLPITKQPTTFTKEAKRQPNDDVALVAPSGGACSTVAGSSASSGRDSIICPQCNRCRCEACRTPRPLPSKWLCQDKFLCSAEACIDYASCLCCVKGLFYHCAVSQGEEDGGTCADRPCSCAPHHRLARWGCLASISLALPCLACYWPLKGALKVVEMCYQRCTRHGCRCDHPPASPGRHTAAPSVKHAIVSQPLPSKRLLDTD